MFCWATVVYCPVVYWIWGGGWALSYRSGALDYAGGGPWKSYRVCQHLFIQHFWGEEMKL